ncbi:MAG: PspC domain-containing protein, partial [Limisphaerales bacterium]
RTSGAPTAGGAGPRGKEGVKSGQRQPKRLYRIREGAMGAGVCNGIGAYFNLDPTLIRLAFAFSTILWGAGIMVYIVLMFVIPEAVTPEEKAAATGDPPLTAEEFIRRAKEGYYKAMKGFPNKRARRQWASIRVNGVITGKTIGRLTLPSIRQWVSLCLYFPCFRAWQQFFGFAPSFPSSPQERS